MKNHFLTGFAAIAATAILATQSNSATAPAFLARTVVYDTVPNNMDSSRKWNDSTRMYDTSNMHRDSSMQRLMQ